MGEINKARFWVGVLYPENMVDDWESQIGDIVQLPYAYCIHDKDLEKDGDDRKVHIHIILAFPNTTTQKHAFNVFDLLSAEGKKCLSSCKAVVSVRGSYDYLIHDTETARKAGKYLYDKSARITGNNFDIGAYEQVSIADKIDIAKEICRLISELGFTNFIDLYEYVIFNYDDVNYFIELKLNASFFEKLTKGNYQRMLNRSRID